MVALLLMTLARAADAGDFGPYEVGLSAALPGMLLDGLDRPSWRADDRVKAPGALGRVASYGGLGAMTVGVARDGGGRTPAAAFTAGTLLGASLALDVTATVGRWPRTDVPKALSGTAATARIGALLVLMSQHGANARREPSFGVGAAPTDGGGSLVVAGRF